MKRLSLWGGIPLALVTAALVLPGAAARAAGNSVGTLRMAGGPSASYAIERDGSLWAWGSNSMGELGLGTTKSCLLPHRVGSGNSWAALAAGNDFCLALRRDGSLWAWGSNDEGQLGLGWKTFGYRRLSPTRVGGHLWKAIGAGAGFSLAIRRDGSLWVWGNNQQGDFGIGSTAQVEWRVRVGTDTDWKAIAVGYEWVLALKSDDSLWAWGSNAMGELGLGDTVDRYVPTQVGTATDWKAISAGGDGFGFAISQDGSLWAWGDNAGGQLGLGDRVQRHVPTQVGHGTTWTRIVGASEFSLAIKREGSLWAWGQNNVGQLGLGDKRSRLVPTRVTRLP